MAALTRTTAPAFAAKSASVRASKAGRAAPAVASPAIGLSQFSGLRSQTKALAARSAPAQAAVSRRAASTVAMATAPRLGESASSLISNTKCFIFDCDGVIWKGDSVIEGVPETLAMLRSAGKQLVFVTNNSTKSRAGYLKKFISLGLDVKAEEIFSSSFAAAAYLKSIDFKKKVYVVGEVGIQEEFDLAGLDWCGGENDKGKTIDLAPGLFLEHPAEVGAVVVGFDRHINYHKIQMATLCIRENPGCLFIGTNPDAVTHLTDAQEWAGNGSMVGAIKGSTGQEPTIVGKPSGFMLDYIAETFGYERKEICMVGDRLDTDILFGKDGGLTTMLVLSGVTTEETLLSSSNTITPDFYTNKLPDIMSGAPAVV